MAISDTTRHNISTALWNPLFTVTQHTKSHCVWKGHCAAWWTGCTDILTCHRRKVRQTVRAGLLSMLLRIPDIKFWWVSSDVKFLLFQLWQVETFIMQPLCPDTDLSDGVTDFTHSYKSTALFFFVDSPWTHRYCTTWASAQRHPESSEPTQGTSIQCFSCLNLFVFFMKQ